jgi:hypothetical protein
MGRVNEGFGALYVGVAAAMYFKPEYAFYDSRTVTVAVLFSILTVSRILYQVALYPELFTPLKHIPAPGVWISPIASWNATNRHNSGTQFAHGPCIYELFADAI